MPDRTPPCSFRAAARLAVALLFLPGGAAAQHVRLTLDNDAFALRDRIRAADRDYSSGLRLEWLRRDGIRVALGHEIYTPRIEGPSPVPGERPYAAFLYAEIATIAEASGYRGDRSFSVAVGVVGPPALGEPIQNGIHELTGMSLQEGWDQQLHLGAIAQATYADGLRLPLAPDTSLVLAPFTRLTVGRLRIGTTAGATLRLGSGASEGVSHRRGFGAHLSAAGVWKPYDALLDSDAELADALRRTHLYGRFEAGVGYRMTRWTLAYRLVVVAREYASQPGPHAYGSISLAWHPRD